MKAVIMAGGRGTRLHPFTALMPKPLVPVGDMPVLELVLRQLNAHGVDEVVLAVNHLHHLIESYFGDGRQIGLKIRYWVEKEPLGTCGSLSGFLDTLPESFLLMNGDILTDFDYSVFESEHISSGASATIAAHRRTHKVEFGVLETNESNQLRAYIEKPEVSHLVSMGIYMLQRDRIAPLLHGPTYQDIPSLLTDLMQDGQVVATHPNDSFWLDIGNPADYARAQEIMTNTPGQFLPAGRALARHEG